MSDDESIYGRSDAAKRLKKELKSLPRIKAPWFLEAELQRRLQEGRNRSRVAGFIGKPLPAYALSVVGVVSLGVLAYVFLLQRPVGDSMETESPGQVNETLHGQQQVPDKLPPLSRQTPAEPTPSVIESPGRGPSGFSADAAIEAKIEQNRSSEVRQLQSDAESELAAPAEQGAQEEFVREVLPSQIIGPRGSVGSAGRPLDSLGWNHVTRDSLDSLRRHADSLKNVPRR